MSSLKVSSVNLNSGENTKIGIAVNDLDLSITANGKNGILVDSNGRVGINLTTPTSNLHVVGSANITGNLIINGNTIFVDTISNEVGIGIANPTSNLHVVGTTANTLNVTGNTVVTGTMFANNFVGYGTGFSNMQVFATPSAITSSQSWTIPSGVRRFKVTLVGAGASGGGAPAFAGAVGHGGGAGGYSVKYFDVVPGVTTVSVNVGTAGGISLTSFVSVNANGNTAWPSNVNYNNQWVFANAGTQGANGYFMSNVRTTAALGGSIGLGGDAAGGDLNIFGQDGQQGAAARGAVVSGTANVITGGQGGNPPMGYGFGGTPALTALSVGNPSTGTYASGNGSNAIGFGGGGSGARAGGGTNFSVNKAGGAGANGVVIIEW